MEASFAYRSYDGQAARVALEDLLEAPVTALTR